ncbi:MAG: M48 family metallopeptidase [Clostridiales Family XIII bacterium]|jgi:predicted metal-dependent hydrolase|nr:M48 family metallopeptidase [Clostridiales Family XIII bacterium]
MIDYTLTRSKRKTLALYIRGGGVEVRAPLKMSKRDIDSFVTSKEGWIADKLTQSREQAARREAFALRYGDTLTLRGAEYPLIAREGTRAGFDGEGFYLPSGLTSGQIKAVCARIYRRLAKIHLTERASHFAQSMRVAPAAVKINGAKTRWGSCSAKKSLNFSWRLLMADDAVIDYVVVHELAHITEMNHSTRFWAIVESVLPDCRERRNRLKALQRRQAIEDWD